MATMLLMVASGCTTNVETNNSNVHINKSGQSVYQDVPFLQDYSIQYFLPEGKKGKVNLYQVAADRNKNIQILSSAGLLSPRKGHFKEPGTLLPVVTYKYMKDKQITGLLSYQNQFVYTDDKAVFSNAWAGGLYAAHGSKSPRTIAGGDDFSFLVSDHEKTTYIRNGNKVWEEKLPAINSIKFNAQKNNYLLVSTDAVSLFDPAGNKLTTIYKGRNLTCATFAHMGEKIVVGSTDGYRWLNANGSTDGEIITHVPSANISDVEEIDGTIWFGSRAGAFALNKEGKYDYYASQRWLPDNNVLDIAAGPDKSILVLTEKGLGQICFKMMTLEEKAMILEEETRKNHIRYGFSSTGEGMENGDRSLLTITDSDNDGLWTAMYLGGQLFRYAVTKDAEAWENCKEALMGFERLYSITGVPGLPARAYEVMGYESSGYSNAFSESTRHLFESSGYDVANSPWRNGTDKGWVWKSTTSSDEIVGHYFALSLFADLADDPVWKNRAKKLLTELSEHIYKNNLYLVDWNGKPTTWGKWNPEYVNEYPPKVGDRKITSSNITAFLQSAYHFTRDEKYKQKIFELFDKHGYLENLMRPMNEIGKVEGSDDGKIDSWAEMLSDGWNHSDDEMYFLGYWSLYPYALNDTLREKYREAIRDHWEIERPEKDPTWNFTYAMTGAKDFDLDESIWWLKRHPLDLTLWKTENSQRQDIKKLPENFRKQFTEEVISPAEAPVNKHNGNRFELDSNGNGNNAETPGDVWLLPYWMGRYLDVISAPVKQ